MSESVVAYNQTFSVLSKHCSHLDCLSYCIGCLCFIIEIFPSDICKVKDVILGRTNLPQEYDVVLATGSLPLIMRH